MDILEGVEVAMVATAATTRLHLHMEVLHLELLQAADGEAKVKAQHHTLAIQEVTVQQEDIVPSKVVLVVLHLLHILQEAAVLATVLMENKPLMVVVVVGELAMIMLDHTVDLLLMEAAAVVEEVTAVAIEVIEVLEGEVSVITLEAETGFPKAELVHPLEMIESSWMTVYSYLGFQKT